jgi:hypothetical protein
MTIKQTVLAALTPVLGNTWAVELPERPTWPAIVFDIDTQPERGWVLGAGYDQHVVNVVTLARDLDEIEVLMPQIRAAITAVAGFMDIEEEGDADYEGDAEVYAYFQNFRIRTRTL